MEISDESIESIISISTIKLYKIGWNNFVGFINKKTKMFLGFIIMLDTLILFSLLYIGKKVQYSIKKNKIQYYIECVQL